MPIAPVQPTRRPGVPVWLAAVAGLGLLGGGYALRGLMLPAPAPQPSAVFDVVGDSLYDLVATCCGRSVAISPQGDRLAYQGRPRGKGHDAPVLLYQRLLNQPNASPIPGTEDAHQPFFSPDGKWVGFFAGNDLKKVGFDGGAPLTVASNVMTGDNRAINRNAGAAWAPDNSIVYSFRNVPGLFRVAEGGKPTQITALDTVAGEVAHYMPHVMPDGRTVLFGVSIKRGDGPPEDMIAETPLDGGGHRIIRSGKAPGYVEPGFLVFSDDHGSIMAQPFDARSLEVRGEPFRIGEGAVSPKDGTSESDISRNGTLAYLHLQNRLFSGTLVSVDTSGTERVLVSNTSVALPRFSPDGRSIAYYAPREGGGSDIWVWDVARRVPTRLTYEGDNRNPTWAHDGGSVLYGTTDGIMARASDGSGEARSVVASQAELGSGAGPPSPEVSPDGRWLVWTKGTIGHYRDIWYRPMSGGEAKPLLQSEFDETSPTISPDGHWIAYLSNASGTYEVYVERFPELGHRVKVTTGGARGPRWSPDGKRLYFTEAGSGGETVLAVVDVRTADELEVGTPRTLFDAGAYAYTSSGTTYDIAPDGKHFVFVRTGGVTVTQFVITNALNPGLH